MPTDENTKKPLPDSGSGFEFSLESDYFSSSILARFFIRS